MDETIKEYLSFIHFFEDLKRNTEKLKITKRIIGRRCLRKSHSFKPSEIKMLIYFQIYFLMKKRDAMWKTIERKRKEQKSLFSNEVFKCFFPCLFREQTSIKRRKCRQKSDISSSFINFKEDGPSSLKKDVLSLTIPSFIREERVYVVELIKSSSFLQGKREV